MKFNTKFAVIVSILSLIGLQTAWSQASKPGDNYPDRPVRVIVPFAAGGGTDTVARLVSQKLSERLGKTFVVENRPGAGGNIGTAAVAKAAPDGYTLLLAYGSHASNVSLYRNLPFDPIKDFAAIGLIARLPAALVVHPSVNAKTVGELIELAKSGKLNFASGGIGTPNHLAGEMFKRVAKVDIVHVPYKGIGPGNTALLAGEVQLGFPGLSTVMSHIESGKLRALAVTSLDRSVVAPNIQTLHELGLTGFNAVAWLGLLAPAKTPQPIVDRLNAELRFVIENTDLKQILLKQGNELAVGSSAEFLRFIDEDVQRWKAVISEAGIVIEQ